MADNKISFTAKYRRNYVAFLAVFLFVLIITGEIALATVIPVAMRNEDLMAEEAARNDLLLLFDKTRVLCNSITGKNARGQEDNLISTEKQLLSDALDRFARYMRSMAEKTQFIVITHRRGTMEEADVLYGVTMQEQGISRMLTINLNDVERELNIR